MVAKKLETFFRLSKDDDFVKSRESLENVIPAKAGIQ